MPRIEAFVIALIVFVVAWFFLVRCSPSPVPSPPVNPVPAPALCPEACKRMVSLACIEASEEAECTKMCTYTEETGWSKMYPECLIKATTCEEVDEWSANGC